MRQGLLQNVLHQLMCCADLNTRCAWQESHLAVLWTIGVFALNFGPVVVGPILDYVGPKLTAMLGEHSHAPDQANTPLKHPAFTVSKPLAASEGPSTRRAGTCAFPKDDKAQMPALRWRHSAEHRVRRRFVAGSRVPR